MNWYETIIFGHWIIAVMVAVLYTIYAGGLWGYNYLHDYGQYSEDRRKISGFWVFGDWDDNIDDAGVVFTIFIIVGGGFTAALVWVVLDPILTIMGALHLIRSRIRLQKKIDELSSN